MTTTTRRAVLAGTAAAIPAVALASIPAFAAADRVETLWRERSALMAQMEANSTAYGEALARLPEWARSGPECMDHEGNRCGTLRGSPEIKDPKPPKSGGAGSYTRIRPSSDDYRRDYEVARTLFGEKAARKRYRDNLRRFVARKREQEAEKERCGVNAIVHDDERISYALSAIEDELEALAPQCGLNGVGALLLIHFEYVGADGRSLPALRALLPHLTGVIANDAAAFLAAAPADDDEEDDEAAGKAVQS